MALILTFQSLAAIFDQSSTKRVNALEDDQGRIQDFRRRSSQNTNFSKFPQKLHEIKTKFENNCRTIVGRILRFFRQIKMYPYLTQMKID